MATTKVDPKLNESNVAEPAKTYQGLTSQQLIDAYRIMFASRRVDDREILLKRQQKVFFQISGAGHEALGVAAALALKPSYDWFYAYYRDRALCLALGATPYEMLLGAVGAADDPSSGGRQMPSHWAYKRLNVVTQSSCTGTQILQAVGCAEAGRYFARHPKASQKAEGDYRQFKDVQFQGDEVTYVSLGDGTTSEGEFWEALNTASNRRLPVIFCVQDNEYAISVPVEVQTAGGNISRLVSGFPNFHFEEIDGTDPVVAYAAFKRASDHCRAGHGPAFVHAHVIRPYSHSLSDDERLYRPEAERRADAARDPVPRLQMFLLREGILDEKGINQIEQEIEEQIQADADRALEAAVPQPDTIYNYVYSPDLDPTSAAFNTQPASAAPETATDGKRSADSQNANPQNANPQSATPQNKPSPNKTMADLINTTLRDEMRRDERVIIFGEDVADASREEYLKQKVIKGKGGVFKLTAGLQIEFGSDRIFNSPLAEANIVGRATGMATRGLKPVVEIQFFDYIGAGGGPRGDWRLSDGRRHLPLAVRRKHLHAYSRIARRVPFERARCRGPAAHCDPLRRPGLVPRTQAPLPRNLRARALSRPELHGSVWKSEDRAARNRPHRYHLWRGGSARAAGRAKTGARAPRQRRTARPAVIKPI